MTRSIPHDERPLDPTPVHTSDLPATPQRDRRIPVSAWVEAPESLRNLGQDLADGLVVSYLRRIGPWLLWRVGPPTGADARYWAAPASGPDQAWTFRLFPDGTGDGVGPSGQRHSRFRTWKEDLRDHEVNA